MTKHYTEYSLNEYAELFGSGNHFDDLTEKQKAFRLEVQRQRAEENRAEFKRQQAAFSRLKKIQTRG